MTQGLRGSKTADKQTDKLRCLFRGFKTSSGNDMELPTYALDASCVHNSGAEELVPIQRASKI